MADDVLIKGIFQRTNKCLELVKELAAADPTLSTEVGQSCNITPRVNYPSPKHSPKQPSNHTYLTIHAHTNPLPPISTHTHPPITYHNRSTFITQTMEARNVPASTQRFMYNLAIAEGVISR